MIEPTSGDILLGRGVPINKVYREIISANAATYAALSTKSEKTNMSANIVAELLNSNPPRRFLEKSETGKWQEVPLKRAQTKTSQALRDAARDRAKAAAKSGNSSENNGGGAVAALNNVSNNQEAALDSSSSTPAAAAMPSYHPPAPNLLYPVAEFTATETTMINSSSKEEDPFLLSEWIRRTLNEAANRIPAPVHSLTAEVRDTLALCSDDYLLPALRVAWSLADQLCKAEQEVAGQSLPVPRTNWADSIVVHLHPDPDGSERRSNFIGNTTEDHVQNAATEEDRLDNIGAELLPSLFKSESDNGDGVAKHDRSRTQHIYSLGLVFYEIFSGGRRPPEIEQQQKVATRSGDAEAEEFSIQEELGDLDSSLLVDRAVPIDVEGKLSIFDNIEDEFNTLPKKRHVTQNSDFQNKCAVSVEPLKGKRVPVQLCDLIANMVDCVNGTLSGDDAYQSMSHVRDDLQLMLERPAIYLYDQDMGRLSMTGLQLGHTVFDRNEELSSLKECYRRSVSGKFDQLQQGKPFSALASAFNGYCGMLMQSSELQTRRQVVASKLRSSLGRE
eukprot:scaffold1963_cov89-Skeletonema_dohrnii-CCMP3373.AAC.1